MFLVVLPNLFTSFSDNCPYLPLTINMFLHCRVPGSRWALEQAKHNLLTKYLVVGITEELGDFIAMLEVILPRFFKGASDLYMNGEYESA